jgi:4-deoxy-L-threo-5-hexosulose-uronate ketol-isomerase
MKTRNVADQERYQRMTTQELRESFLVESLFQPDVVELVYTDVDRAVIGSVVPTESKIALGTSKAQLAAEYFAERREVGIINTGSPGAVVVDGKTFAMDNCDGLYIGRGSKRIDSKAQRRRTRRDFF